MIQVKFKNLERSEMACEAVEERFANLIQKFPDLGESKLQVTLAMENSRTQAGPDLFKVKLCILRGRYDGVTIEKADPNLYIALAELVDHMLESLNRFGDKARVKARKKARDFALKLDQTHDMETQKSG